MEDKEFNLSEKRLEASPHFYYDDVAEAVKKLKGNIERIRKKMIKEHTHNHYKDLDPNRWNDLADPLDYVLEKIDKIFGKFEDTSKKGEEDFNLTTNCGKIPKGEELSKKGEENPFEGLADNFDYKFADEVIKGVKDISKKRRRK